MRAESEDRAPRPCSFELAWHAPPYRYHDERAVRHSFEDDSSGFLRSHRMVRVDLPAPFDARNAFLRGDDIPSAYTRFDDLRVYACERCNAWARRGSSMTKRGREYVERIAASGELRKIARMTNAR